MACMEPPQLSNCFFQYFLDESAPADFMPVLQVLEARNLQMPGSNQIQWRTRLSDGVFSYSGGVVLPTIAKKFQSDGLCSHNGIIKVTNWRRAFTNGKICFNLGDYEMVSLDFPVIGNPQPHSGKVDDYKGQSFLEPIGGTQSPTAADASKKDPSQWQNSQVKEEPENVWGKRGREVSPAADFRPPLRKRQQAPERSMQQGITPIACITPYLNKWRICGQVSAKDQDIKDVSNARGNFRVFSFIITDQAGNSIRVTAFGEQADKFFPIINNGEVYYVSGGGRPGSVKASNKQFSNTGHDYDLVLDRDSEISFCTDVFTTPKLRLKPTMLKFIPQHVNECLDVQGIVERVADVVQVTSRKDQKQLNKRDVYIIDHSGVEVCLTLWGENATNFNVQTGNVLGVRGALVKEFNNGFSLSTILNTQLLENPDNDFSQRLYLWYRDQKPTQEIKMLSTDSAGSFERDFHFIGPIIRDGIGRDNDKGQFFTIKAMVNAVKSEQAIYQACPIKGCKKKVVMEGNQYRCEKCSQNFDNYTNMIMLQMELADCTGTAWVTIFDELATVLLKVNGDDLATWQRENHDQYEEAFNSIRFHDYVFRVRVKYETYNDQQQMKWSVYDVKPLLLDKCKQLYQNALKQLEEQGRLT